MVLALGHQRVRLRPLRRPDAGTESARYTAAGDIVKGACRATVAVLWLTSALLYDVARWLDERLSGWRADDI